MTKAELIEKVADKTGFTKKDSGKAVDALFDAITASLADGEKVSLVGFGTFSVRRRERRKGRNPQTGKEITIPARKVPVFKAGKPLKELVAKR
ncbi:MAG: HU family DNA-binding protein [Acetobacteraceae bacterium]|nr:HU family DNA-binding protein [Acetobacteraceae bacterium]